MAFVRGIVLPKSTVESNPALRDQLQLLRWGGLELALLEGRAGLDGPSSEGGGNGGSAGGGEGLEVLVVPPLPLTGGAPGSGAPAESAAVAAAAEAAVQSWAARVGVQWPGEVLLLGGPGDEAGCLRTQLRSREQQQQQQQQQPEDASSLGAAGDAAWGLRGLAAEEEEPAGHPIEREDDAPPAPTTAAPAWGRLRLALAHENLRRAGEAGSPLVVVGTCMKASRERDLAKEGLLNLVPQDGMVFAPLDLSRSLERQLPFHVVLHKASDELEEGPPGEGPVFGPRIRLLAVFAVVHPYIAIVDPLEAAAKVINRTELARVCDFLSSLDLSGGPGAALGEGEGTEDGQEGKDGGGEGAGGSGGGRKSRRTGPRVTVRAPGSLTLASFSGVDLAAVVEKLGCPPPYIVKPVVACGTPDSHRMALVLTEEGLAALGQEGQEGSQGAPAVPLPAVVQQFVNHDATIYKVYVAGDKVFHTIRPSIPNVPSSSDQARLLAPAGFLTFDSLKSLPTKLGEGAPPPAPHHPPEAAASGPSPLRPRPPSQSALERIAAHLRSHLGLSLFGFDVVVASAPTLADRDLEAKQDPDQDLFVIDVNYFPSYRGAEGAPGLFRAAVLGAYQAQQRQQQQLEMAAQTWRVW